MINKKELVLWGIAAVVAFTFMAIVLLSNSMKAMRTENRHKIAVQAASQTPPVAPLKAQIAAEQDWMSGSILRVEPSVVCICTTGADVAGKGTQLCDVGTGVIISPNGFILTGAQAAGIEPDIKVVVYEHSGLDGPSFEIGHNHIFDAEIVSTFPAAGFSVLKIDGNNLPVANFGDANVPQQGDWCLAIGSAFGQKPTVTSGMISGLNQVKKINGHVYRGLFENTCKSRAYFVGGPLINDEGEIIGLIIDKGYAMSSNRITPALDGLGIPGFSIQ